SIEGSPGKSSRATPRESRRSRLVARRAALGAHFCEAVVHVAETLGQRSDEGAGPRSPAEPAFQRVARDGLRRQFGGGHDARSARLAGEDGRLAENVTGAEPPEQRTGPRSRLVHLTGAAHYDVRDLRRVALLHDDAARGEDPRLEPAAAAEKIFDVVSE